MYSVHVFPCTSRPLHRSVTVPVCRPEDNLLESVLSTYGTGSGDGTQIIRLGDKHFNLLSCLSSLQK